jgi:hypothetical protein
LRSHVSRVRSSFSLSSSLWRYMFFLCSSDMRWSFARSS